VKTATEIVGTGPSQTNRKRIQLSIEPHHLNGAEITKDAPCRGQVTSVEDHGVVVSLGNHRKGFLKFVDIAEEYSLEASGEDDHDTNVNKGFIHEGRVLDFVVKPEKTTVAIVPLALPSHTKMTKTALPTTFHPPLSDLNPGSLVNVKVESLARNGLCVSFLGGVFRGSIDLNHFGAHWRAEHRQPNMEWKTLFDEIRSTPARIIAVDAKTKLVRLSLQPHLLAMRVVTNTLPAVGSSIQDATVVRVDPGVGALFALPKEYNIEQPKLMDPLAKHEGYVEASKVQTAYVHISKAVDGRMTETEFAKDFAPSTTHTIRIMSNNNWMEGVATCATAPSVVDAHVLTHADLKTGKIYQAVPVCVQLKGGSIMVDFGMGVKGLIPSHHLFDKANMTSEYRLKLRKEKFATGNKIDVRVLELDVSQRKCTLTAKKSLLKAKDCLTSYDDIQIGQQATGFISKIEDRALFITFYNRVYGRVTARSLAAELGVENIRENYTMGDVLTCRVISCHRRVGKNRREYEDEDTEVSVNSKSGYWDLNLSLNVNDVVTNDDQQSTYESSTSTQVVLQAGAVLPPNSMKVVEIVPCSDKKRGGEFVPGHAIVRIKTKYLLKNKEESNALPHIDCKLPFDQLLDSYKKDDIESKEAMDKFAGTHLTIGKKLNCKGLILTDPKKSNDEYSSGIGKLPILSLRLKLIETAETQSNSNPEDEEDPTALVLPSTNTHLFMGAYVQGYVAQADPRHGSFVRFLDGLTGLVPKLKKGLELSKFETVSCKIVALDVTTSPMKILLKSAGSQKSVSENRETRAVLIKPGDDVGTAEIVDVNFMRASVNLLGKMYSHGKIRARLHVTMTNSESLVPPTANKKLKSNGENKITKNHPFYKWKKGQKLSNLTCVAVDVRKGVTYVELMNKAKESGAESDTAIFVDSVSELNPGIKISAIVTAVPKSLRGLWVQVSPGVTAFIPSLELSNDVDILNDLPSYFPVGSKLRCQVMNKQVWQKKKHWGEKMRQLADDGEETKKSTLESNEVPFLSLLLVGLDEDFNSKPLRGDLVVGRVNHSLRQQRAPALMLELRGGFTGRCCITELDEPDDWINMPLGRIQIAQSKASTRVAVKGTEDTFDDEVADMDVEADDEEVDAR
jgi:ribosomal protein S1